MANLASVDDASSIFSFAAERFMRISRQHLVTDGERHGARSGELPPTASHLVTGRTYLSGEQQSGSSPSSDRDFLDPPMVRSADQSRRDMDMTGSAKLLGDRS